jgi:uncharacterized protein (TIGR03000 family)
MYGVVLMMALTTSAENPDFGRRGCNGCGGGGYYASCCGGGYSRGCCGGGYSSGCGGCGGVGYGGRMGYGGYMGERYYASGYETTPSMDGSSSSSYFPPDATTSSPAPGAAAATVRITMPADSGRLTIDDYTVPSMSDRHVYVTLPINTNDTRKISFKTEVMKDGKRETVTRQVTVKPGQTANVDFTTKAGPNP